MPTTFEKNQLRKSHRVNLPAKAFMAGGEYPVLDWSLEGFRCSVPNDDLHDDWVGDVTFILPLSGMNVTFDAVARLRRRGESGAGFSFDSINDRSKMLLKTYIQASIEGKLDDIQGIISRVEATEIPMETEKPLTMEERTAFRRSFTGRALVYWVLGIVLFGLILLVLYNNFSRAVSTRGVVSGALVDVAPEMTGYLREVPVSEGDSVEEGQTLFVMDDSHVLRRIEQIKLDIEVAKQELSQLFTDLAEEDRALGMYRSAADLQVQMVQQQMQGVRAKIDLAKKEFKRAEALLASGVVSRSFWDERRKTMLEEEARLAELNEELKLARRNVVSTKDGKYLSDGAARGRTRELSADIEVQKRKLEAQRYRLVEAMADLEKTHVAARQAGEVYSVKRIAGTFLRPGESVMTVRAKDVQPWILARFTFQEAQRLSPGDAADVYVPSSGRLYHGTVRALGHHAMASGGAVSQDLEISMNEVPVKISLDEPAPELVPGLGVEARVSTPVLPEITAYFGELKGKAN